MLEFAFGRGKRTLNFRERVGLALNSQLTLFFRSAKLDRRKHVREPSL